MKTIQSVNEICSLVCEEMHGVYKIIYYSFKK